MGVQGGDTGDTATVTAELALIDRCKPFPCPPTSFSVQVSETDTVAVLRDVVARERGYDPETFAFHVAPKDEQTHAHLFMDLQETTLLADLKLADMVGRLSIQAAEGMDDRFPADTVAEVHGRVTGQEMVPLHGPRLPSIYDEEDVYGVYGYGGGSYGSSAYGPAWDSKSRTGYVALESKVGPSYLTSVLQILYLNVPFRRLVLSWPYADWMTHRLNADPSGRGRLEKLAEHEPRSVMTQLQRLFARLMLLDERMTKTGPLLRALGKGERAHDFDKLEVDDFLAHLFLRMDDECIGTPLEGKLDDMVRLRVRTCILCKECGKESTRTDSLACWKVDVRTPNGDGTHSVISDLSEGTQNFLSLQEGPHQCSVCAREVVAVTRRELVYVPPFLFVLLNRFVFMSEYGRRSKVRQRITFPTNLSLHKYAVLEEDSANVTLPDSQYKLTGAVCHLGPSQGGTHYGLLQGERAEAWFQFADQDVEEVYDLSLRMEAAYGKKTIHQEDDECAYLLAYVRTGGESVRAPSIMDVPDFLQELVLEEHQARKDRKQRKLLDRQMQKLKVMYGDEIRELRVHGSKSMEEVTVATAELFGISQLYDRHQYRLRMWDDHYHVPKETWGTKLSHTVSSLRFYQTDILMLETLQPHEVEFVEYDHGCMSCKVYIYDSSTNSFSGPRIVTFTKRTDTFSVMKRTLERELGIPYDEQRVFKESLSENVGTLELLGDNEQICYKLQVWEGSTLYVEHSDAPPTEPSPCQAEVDRVKNQAQLAYVYGEKEVTLEVDRRDSLYVFKTLVADQEHLDLDRFKVFQLFAGGVKVELKNEDQPLHELLSSHSRDPPTKLEVLPYVPRDAEELAINFVLATTSGTGHRKLVPLLEAQQWKLASPVAEVKEQLRKALKPEQLEGRTVRLREVGCGGVLGNILAPQLTLKDALQLPYSGMSVALELIAGADAKTSDNIVVTAVLFRGDWTLSAPKEVVLDRHMPMDSIYERLADEFAMDVELVGVAKATGKLTALDAPQLDWDPKVPIFIKTAAVASKTVSTAPMYLRDGDVLVVRDRTEEMQQLTDEMIHDLKGYKQLNVDRAAKPPPKEKSEA